MAVVAYLRVSTEKQFLENQREEIIRFAEKNGLSIFRSIPVHFPVAYKA